MCQPQIYLHPPPTFPQNTGQLDPLEHFLANTDASWWYIRNVIPSPQVKNPICNTKITVHHNIFTIEKRGLHILSMSTAVLPSSKWSFGNNCAGLSFPLKIYDLHKIKEISHNIVWRSFSKGCGFYQTHMNPGSNLLYHFTMLPASTLIQDGLKSSAMFFPMHLPSASYKRINPHTTIPYLYT